MNESRGFSALMRLIRPKQWIKNGFVFVPLFFGGALFNTDALLAGVITFFAYSFAASSIYCFNDIFDAEADRRHPVKCHRPIASGAVSVKAAYCLMILMLILSIVISAALDSWKAMGIILFYWLLNLCYCAKLKQYAIIDVCIVAFGFVLRLLAGGVATDIALSKWIVLMTFLITLFMSFAKRALRYASQNYNFDKDQYDKRWTGPGSTNSAPSAAALLRTWNVSDQKYSSYFVESADYFRIQDITLGYTFKNLKFGTYTLPSVRLSMTADRPFTTFKANTFSPELTDPEGWDTEVYPLTSTYTFNVKINF